VGDQEQVEKVHNSITDIKKYLSTEEDPLTMQEFKEFWDSLNDSEKEQYKTTPLPVASQS
jgi:hypothetical protein